MKPTIIIKNYTTEKAATTTIAEIEQLLVQIGAKMIVKDYDDKGKVSALSFIIMLDNKRIPIKLPARVDRIPVALRRIFNTHHITQGQRKMLRKAMNDSEQAERIGWRILKDWLEAQVAIMTLDQINMLEALLPFTVWRGNKTLYELLEQDNFDMSKTARTLIEYKNDSNIQSQ